MYKKITCMLTFFCLLTIPIFQINVEGHESHPSEREVLGMEEMGGDMKGEIRKGAVSCMKGHEGMGIMKPLIKGKDFDVGRIVIKRPVEGEIITSHGVMVKWEIVDKGSVGNHVHIYLDGDCKVMVRSGNSHYLSGIKEGRHAIGVRLVSKDHQETGAEDWVTIEIRRKGGKAR